MLPRHLRPRVRRIRAQGDPATGVVTAVMPARRSGVTLTLQVALPGGEAASVARRVEIADVPRLPEVGDRIPVRYDRRRPHLVEVDVDALRGRP